MKLHGMDEDTPLGAALTGALLVIAALLIGLGVACFVLALVFG